MHMPSRLTELRLARDLTQARLAEHLGVDPSTVYRWEAGELGIPDARKVQIAEHFGVTVGHLMCWTEATR